jgi:molybdopterin synthase sulfur carrier subunit
MKITVLYFARLREVFGLSSETLTLPDGASVNALLEILRQRGEVWAENLAANRAFRVAVNQDVVTGDALLSEGAEVAVFPPVTGG